MRNRVILLTTLLLMSRLGVGQTYSALKTDKEIYAFLNWMTKKEKKYREEPFYRRKQIYYKISNWDTFNFIRKDTVDNRYYEDDMAYLFYKRDGADTIFKAADRAYLIQQYFAIKDSVWHTPFHHSRLTRNNRQFRPNRYYYSMPLFSVDHQYVIVQKTYYCGRLCAVFGYFVYRKIDPNHWELVTCIKGGIS